MLRSRYCRRCGGATTCLYNGPRLMVHTALTVLTLGLWAPVLLGVALFGGSWKCVHCGSKT